jgi:hypothetical protein
MSRRTVNGGTLNHCATQPGWGGTDCLPLGSRAHPEKKKWFDENWLSLRRHETSTFGQHQEICRQLQPCNLQKRVSRLPSRPGHVAE